MNKKKDHQEDKNTKKCRELQNMPSRNLSHNSHLERTLGSWVSLKTLKVNPIEKSTKGRRVLKSLRNDVK